MQQKTCPPARTDGGRSAPGRENPRRNGAAVHGGNGRKRATPGENGVGHGLLDEDHPLPAVGGSPPLPIFNGFKRIPADEIESACGSI